MALKYIDISEHQKNINYDELSKHIDGVILRAGVCGYGTLKIKREDLMFKKHYENFKRLGVPVGVYWYSCAYTEAEAIEEAEKLLDIIKDKEIDLPVFIDVEDAHNTSASGCAKINQAGLSKDHLSKVVKAFCDRIEAEGYYVGIYASRSWMTDKLDSEGILKQFDKWIAEWNASCNFKGQYGMWQYSSSVYMPGYDGRLDASYAYKDYNAIIKKAGLNKKKKEEVESDEKQDIDIKKEISEIIDKLNKIMEVI